MEGDALWKSVLGEIELSVSRGSYVTWFKKTRLLRHSPEEMVIGVPNIFAKQQLELKFKDLVTETLKKKGVEIDDLSFKVHTPRDAGINKRAKEEEVVQVSFGSSDEVVASNDTNNVSSSYRQGLNHRYTFDSFVSGSGNELAYAACRAVAENPGTKYNPLFIYGGVGIGKTHLIQAIGNDVLKRNPKAKVVYATSEQFIQEFTDAIRYKKAGAFAQHYRSVDVLIVDDIQFIAGKQGTQDEFFHTFNVLHQANKQVVISSDQPPNALPTVEDRLKSRFQMGMSIDMQTPDYETRCAILRSKADVHDFVMPTETIDYLANNFPTNIRELEGALNQLMAYCDMRATEPTIEIAKTVFAKQTARPKNISSKQIIDKICKYYNVKPTELLGPKRDKDIVVPRQVTMFLLRDVLSLSYPKIANELGRKDHTTAIHSVAKIKKELDYDLVLKQQIQEIKEMLNV